MRDTCKPYRVAIYNLLNGNLGTFQGSTIKLFDEKKKVGETGSLYVVLSTQSETPTDLNDCAFIVNSVIDIEIIRKSGFEVTKNDIDEVANTIYGLILPDVQTSGLTTPSGFQFDIPVRTRSLTRNLSITDAESVLTKIITFSTRITIQS